MTALVSVDSVWRELSSRLCTKKAQALAAEAVVAALPSAVECARCTTNDERLRYAAAARCVLENPELGQEMILILVDGAGQENDFALQQCRQLLENSEAASIYIEKAVRRSIKNTKIMAALASASSVLALSCLEWCASIETNAFISAADWLAPIFAMRKETKNLDFDRARRRVIERCCKEIDIQAIEKNQANLQSLLIWLVAILPSLEDSSEYSSSQEVWNACAIAIASSCLDATSRRRCIRLLERSKFPQDQALRALAVAEGGGTQLHLFTPAASIIRQEKRTNVSPWLRAAIARRSLANANPSIRKIILIACLDSSDWDWHFLRTEIAPRLDDVEMRKGKQWSRELDERAIAFFSRYYKNTNAAAIRIHVLSSDFLSSNTPTSMYHLGIAAHSALLACPFEEAPSLLEAEEQDTILAQLPATLNTLKSWERHRNYAQLRQVLLVWITIIEHTEPKHELALEFALVVSNLLHRDKEHVASRLGGWLCSLPGDWNDYLANPNTKNKASLLALLSQSREVHTLVLRHLDCLDFGDLDDPRVIAAVPTDVWSAFENKNAMCLLSESDIASHLEARSRISSAVRKQNKCKNAQIWETRCAELALKVLNSEEENVKKIAIVRACVATLPNLDTEFTNLALRCALDCRDHDERWLLMACLVEKSKNSHEICTAAQVSEALECCGSKLIGVMAVLRCAAHVISSGSGDGRIEDLLRAAFGAAHDCGSRSAKPIILRRLCLEVWAPAWQYEGIDALLLNEAYGLLDIAHDRPHVARILALSLSRALDFGAGSRLAPLLVRVLLYREPAIRLHQIADDDINDHEPVQRAVSYARLCALALIEENQSHIYHGELARETAVILFRIEEDSSTEEKCENKGWSKRLRLWQALGVLAERCTESSILLETMVRTIPHALSRPAPSSVRYAVETAAVGWALRWPDLLVSAMLERLDRVREGDESAFAADLSCGRELALSSLLVVCGHACPESLRSRLLGAAFALQGSTRGIVRGTAQLLLLSLITEDDRKYVYVAATVDNLNCDPDVRRNIERQKHFFTELRAPRLRTLAGLIDSGVHEFTNTEFAESIVVQFRNYLQAQGKLAAQAERESGENLFFSRSGTAISLNSKNDQEEYTESDDQAARQGPILQQRKLDELFLDQKDSALLFNDHFNGSHGQQLDDKKNSRGRVRVVVCASLIDKVVNIAGLARSAEVFDCEAIVVPSRKIVSTPAFESVAVTAERWIPIKECKPGPPLRAWLKLMRKKGYHIVALEQASGSVPLTQCCNKLPTPAVLLLGHEKEGIDVDCLALVDLCVEVPQLGIIRSLNVHVSGALLLWHWAKQYILNTSPPSSSSSSISIQGELRE